QSSVQGCAMVTRASQAHRAHAIVGELQVVTQHIDDLHANVTMVVEEAQQVLAADHGDAPVLQRLSRNGTMTAGECRAEPENFSRTNHAQGQTTAIFRANGQAKASLADKVHATRQLTFTKQHGSLGAQAERFDSIEGRESVRRQIAEE